jgi:aryl-phospho-beta-D-glucosidase BglC (GH1 family)
MILGKGLNVIVDVHPSGEFKHTLAADASAGDAFVVFWEELAERFADTDPERVRLELLNEPEMPAELWEPLQSRLAAVVRAAAPGHTIVLCGAKWSGIDQLVAMQPVDDPNVVYNFHFYEPHQFTHQAATWGAPHWRDMKGLPYPASEEGVRQALAGTTNPAAVNDITRYGQSGWGSEKVREEIGRAAEWARVHGGLTLSCNEFGVYMKAAAPEHRAAWIRDVREAIEAQQIGWTMWDYAGGFALVRDGKPIETVAEALGLR